MKFSFLLVIIFILSITSRSQSTFDFDTEFKKAEAEFNKGQYYTCDSILEKSLSECKCSKTEENSMRELLAKTYLELDHIEKTNTEVYQMFKNNPNFELNNEDEWEDLNNIVKKFRNKSHPLFSAGLRVAPWYPFLKTTKTYSILDWVDYGVPYATGNIEWKFSFWVEYEFIKNFSLNAEMGLSNFSYTRDFQNSLPNGNSFSLNYSEKIEFIELPVYLKYDVPLKKNFISYAGLGMGWLRIYSAKGNTNLSIKSGNNTNKFSDNNIDVMGMRNVNNLEWICTAGIGYKQKNWKVSIDIRYCGGLNSFTNNNYQFNNEILTGKYYYIDNSVKLNMIEIGFGVSYTFKHSIKMVKYY